jgi:hypothetical protein
MIAYLRGAGSLVIQISRDLFGVGFSSSLENACPWKSRLSPKPPPNSLLSGPEPNRIQLEFPYSRHCVLRDPELRGRLWNPSCSAEGLRGGITCLPSGDTTQSV